MCIRTSILKSLLLGTTRVLVCSWGWVLEILSVVTVLSLSLLSLNGHVSDLIIFIQLILWVIDQKLSLSALDDIFDTNLFLILLFGNAVLCTLREIQSICSLRLLAGLQHKVLPHARNRLLPYKSCHEWENERESQIGEEEQEGI